MGNLIGNAKIAGTSTDDVVRTIQALIAAGYKGNELLNKIDEIYGVGARNNLLKVLKHSIPQDRATIVIQYPEITPSEKTKIGDCLIGSNGFVGQITEVSFDSSNIVSSITVLGLGFSVVNNVEPVDDGPLFIIFSGITSYSEVSCNKTWAEIQAAYNAGRLIFAKHVTVYYDGTSDSYVDLSLYYDKNRLYGEYLHVYSVESPADSYTRVQVNMNANSLTIEVTEV